MSSLLHPKVYVLYHGNCFDGFGAAYAAWRWMGNEAEYIPVTHGQPVPEMPDYSKVYIVDFSYDRETLKALSQRMFDLIVIDHHKTAQEALGDLNRDPDFEGHVHFDMNHSGAVLTWQHFFGPDVAVPDLLRYIEDRDLWTFNLPYSREVSEALRSFPMDFVVWKSFDIHSLMSIGEHLVKHTDQQVRMICSQARPVLLDDGTQGVMVNATAFWSEVGHRLLKDWPDSLFAASYYDDKHGNRIYSLRSRPDFDVSDLAKKNGGGGHAQAAGFTVPKGAGLWLSEVA